MRSIVEKAAEGARSAAPSGTATSSRASGPAPIPIIWGNGPDGAPVTGADFTGGVWRGETGYRTDERGSLIGETGAAGLVRAYAYDAWGREAGPHPGLTGYAGGIALPGAGLVHFRARAYDPGTGRWVSADPIGVAGGINLYGYAGGDPVNRVDPSGLCPESPNASCIHDTGGGSGPSIQGFFSNGSRVNGGNDFAIVPNFGGNWYVHRDYLSDGSSRDGAPYVRQEVGGEFNNGLPQGTVLEQRGRRDSVGKRGEAGKNPNPDKPKTPVRAHKNPGYVQDVDRQGQKGKVRPARPGEAGYGENSPFSEFMEGLTIIDLLESLLLLAL